MCRHLVLLFIVATAAGDDLREVVRAVQGCPSDADAVAAVCRASNCDPWLIADELLWLGSFAKAETCARVCDGDAQRLLALIAEYRHAAQPRSTATRDTVLAARTLRIENRPADALVQLARVHIQDDPLLAVQMLWEVALASRDEGASDQGARAFLGVARQAAAVGWRRKASAALSLVLDRFENGEGWHLDAAAVDGARRKLHEGEALFVYGSILGEAIVIMVTVDGRVILPLGDQSMVSSVCESLRAAHECMATKVDWLREHLITPLDLDRTLTKIIVVPSGPVAIVPFAAIAGGRSVTYWPPELLYRLRRAVQPADTSGRGTITIGIDFQGGIRRLHEGIATGRDWSVVNMECDYVEAGGRFRLPGGARAATIGDLWATTCDVLVLSGSRVDFAEDSKHDTWATLRRCVATEAMLGRKSAMELLRIEIEDPSDRTPVRVLLFGEARRVLVHAWDTDDNASEAFLERFFELWKGGEARIDAPGALRLAQGYVASHEDWRDPYYWAGWQLWSGVD